MYPSFPLLIPTPMLKNAPPTRSSTGTTTASQPGAGSVFGRISVRRGRSAALRNSSA